MSNRKDLLIEIGTEELPPKALENLSISFQKQVEIGLKKLKLNFTSVAKFATPRRLAIIISDLDTKQSDSVIEKFGPAIQAAYDSSGAPTKAAQGFARSCGVTVDELQEKSDGKAVKLFHQSTQLGKLTSSYIPNIVSTALTLLPIPKKMRWGTSREEFVRPVHWVVLLFGSELIPASILGVNTATFTFGHRFHHPQKIFLESVNCYEKKLSESAFVIPSFSKRKQLIRDLIVKESAALNSQPVLDDDLLNEVTALVEWPVALTGKFDKKYLNIPSEALISSLKIHQKCFYLRDKEKNILPYFITISNLSSTNPKLVIEGNEKVIGPRLADADFFYRQDQKHTLESLQVKLRSVIFHQKLGTVYDKTIRVTLLSSFIANSLGFESSFSERAAQISKCDLLTSMVGEFADLQGIMGYYYALNDNEPMEVAVAIKEQYLPRYSGDSLPVTNTGIVLALAERLDTLSGLFLIGQPPSGSKDPFALRRSSLAVLRLLIENKLELDLDALITKAILNLNDNIPNTYAVDSHASSKIKDSLLDFIFDRLRTWYIDQGINASVFLSVVAQRPSSPYDFDLRIKAVSTFNTLPGATALAAANKRVANILAKLSTTPKTTINTSLLIEDSEVTLANKLENLITQVQPLLINKDYTSALTAMASLQQPVDDFFENVMVNTDQPEIRDNRLALLQRLRLLFLEIADISQL